MGKRGKFSQKSNVYKGHNILDGLIFDDPHHNESQKLHRYRSNVGPIKPLHEFLAASTGLRSPTP